MAIPATLIPGDGIGPEIMVSIREIMSALGSPFDWDEQQAASARSPPTETRCPNPRSTASAPPSSP